MKDENPQTGGDLMVVTMSYDMRTNAFKLRAPGVPTVMLYGIIQMGMAACIGDQAAKQVMVTLTRMAAEKKVEVVPAGAIPPGSRA